MRCSLFDCAEIGTRAKETEEIRSSKIKKKKIDCDQAKLGAVEWTISRERPCVRYVYVISIEEKYREIRSFFFIQERLILWRRLNLLVYFFLYFFAI